MPGFFYGNGVDMRILLVEDDAGLARTLGDLLVCEGYEVSVCATQDYALALLREEVFDLALLDVSLAQGNGFAVCAAARDIAPEVPVIFVTASDDEYSTVAGLDMGAVDYIAKPFRARELLSRVRAALRRSGAAVSVLKLGDVSIDISSAQVTKGGVEVYLSALEYRLLLHFAQNAGKLVTRDALYPSAQLKIMRSPFFVKRFSIWRCLTSPLPKATGSPYARPRATSHPRCR